MSRGPDSDDADVPSWLLGAARTVGLNEIRVRWKLMRWYRRWRWLRRELMPPSRRFQHQTCPHCGALQDAQAVGCASCGERMGSPATKLLRSVGLSIPAAVSVSSLLGVAMILVYARMMMARPGTGYLSWDVETLVAFGANWAPAVKQGQWWRVATAVVLHIGLWHLAFNLFALSQIGPSIEEVFGRSRMVFAFAATGVLANLPRVAFDLFGVAAGASGALMGLIGMAAGWGQRSGTTIGREVRNQMIKWGAYTIVFGFFIGADNVAHAVGFVAGAAMGFVFRPETLQHTKSSPSSLALGAAGSLVMATSVGFVLAPPASSTAVAAQLATPHPERAHDVMQEHEDCERFLNTGDLRDFVGGGEIPDLPEDEALRRAIEDRAREHCQSILSEAEAER